jgi:hypothetical protein
MTSERRLNRVMALLGGRLVAERQRRTQTTSLKTVPYRLAAQHLVGDGGAPDPDDERGQECAEFRWAVPREAALGGVRHSLDSGFLDCHMCLVPETGAGTPH